ncbi:hypothetical protein [Providencia hangzhouensis]
MLLLIKKEEYPMTKLNEFEKGVLAACAALYALHDQPRMAADIINEFNLSHADCSKIRKIHKVHLNAIKKQENLFFTGLD